MNIKKWLIAGCLVLISLFVQAESQLEEPSNTNHKISMPLEDFILLATTQLLEHLKQEGEQAYYMADYSTAIEKWQEGLELARQENHSTVFVFLNNICGAYGHLADFQKAVEYCLESLEFAKISGLREEEGLALNNIGVIHRELGEHQKALDYHQQALVINRKVGKKAEAHTLNNMGLVYQAQNEYQKAVNVHLQALSINRELSDKPEEANTLNNLGSVYRKREEYQLAEDSHLQALTINRELGDKRAISETLNKLGAVYYFLREYRKALESYQEIDVHQTLDNSGNLQNLCMIHYFLGEYLNALEYCQSALKELGDKQESSEILNQIGLVYQGVGDYQKALDFFQSAWVIYRNAFPEHGAVQVNLADIDAVDSMVEEINNRYVYQQQNVKKGEIIGGHILINLGTLYLTFNQPAYAVENSLQALIIYNKLGKQHEKASILFNIGNVYNQLGYNQKALEYYQQALAINREISDKQGEGNVLANMGIIYRRLGNYQEALKNFEESLAKQRQIGNKNQESRVLSGIGNTYMLLGKYQQAKIFFQQSLALGKRVGDGENWQVHSGLALVEIENQQFEDAIAHFEQAIENIETLRAGVFEKEYQLSFMQDKFSVYDLFINLLQMLHDMNPNEGYDRKALDIFERKQGRLFLEEMGKSGARLFAGLPPDISEQERELENQQTVIRQQWSTELSKPFSEQNHALMSVLKQRQRAIGEQQQVLKQNIKNQYPSYYAIKYPQPATLTELQQQVLDSDELMLVYQVMEKHTLLWVIGKNRFDMFRLPLDKWTLEEKVSELRGMIGTGDNTRNKPLRRKGKTESDVVAQFRKASYELFQQLVPNKQIRELLTEPYTIYVVPTGPLYGLPFGMLVTQAPSESTKVRYLIEEVPIAYLSSASLLKILRDAKKRRQPVAPHPFLAFANPIYDQESSTAVQQSHTITALRHESYRALWGQRFIPLPETELEAKEIAALFNTPDDSEPLHLRDDASRPKVMELNDKKRLDDYQYVLFATHGLLPGEVDHLIQPALVLSYPDIFGYLTMADVFQLKFNAQLITLSACNTGRGVAESGEGIMGLTRAFMYAGTSATAVTLWSVDSLSAKTLSIGFFKSLINQQKTAAALRASKVRLLQGKEGDKYKRPSYWAPFVVFGDAR
jgi:tetratricopeptide (TPR) repeat protein